jgi:hypothetical protein
MPPMVPGLKCHERAREGGREGGRGREREGGAEKEDRAAAHLETLLRLSLLEGMWLVSFEVSW